MRPSCLLLLICLAASPAMAQAPDAQAARERGAAALAARDLPAAEAAYGEALEIERAAAPGSDAVGEALYALAFARSRSPGEDAWPLWDEAVAVFESNGAWVRAAAAAGAGATDHGNGSDWPEALRLARRAVDLADRSGDATAQGQALRVLGLTLSETGDYQAAEPVLLRGLERLGGPTADAAAPILDELGYLYQETHQYDRAGVVLSQALALKERLNGPDSYAAALTLNALGSLRDAQGRAGEAEALYRRALRLAKLNGQAQAETVIRSNLGRAVQAQGRHAEAEPLLRQAAEGVEAMLGPDHEDTAVAWANLALDLQTLDRHQEARALLARAATTLRATLGSDHPLTASILNGLANSTAALGDEAGAGPLFAEALSISAVRLTPGHPDRVRRANDMAEHLLRSGRPDQAIGLIRDTGRDVREGLRAARLGGDSAPVLDRGRRVFGLEVRAAWTLAQ